MDFTGINNEYVKLYIKDGVLVQIFNPKVDRITLDIARSVVQERQKLSRGSKYPLLVDAANARTVDKDARDYWASEESIKDVQIAGFILNSYVALIGAKLFLSFNKPEVRTELFRTQGKAMEWLLENKD